MNMRTLLLLFVLAVLVFSFVTAQVQQDESPEGEQGSMAWHRQVEQQYRQERYFQEVQKEASQEQRRERNQ